VDFEVKFVLFLLKYLEVRVSGFVSKIYKSL